MKGLPPLLPNPPYIDRFIAIRDRKRNPVRSQLVAVQSHIKSQYDALAGAAAANILESLTADAACAAIQDALRACYDGHTSALQELKEALTSAQEPRRLKYCPMCGTTIHSTFDHYIPASRFPEFAVHPLNLVPCCAKCNSAKGDDWLTSTGKRRYINAYIDNIPDVQFLTAILHESMGYAAVGATFSIVCPASINQAIWTLIDNHFARLDLLQRYNELSNDEISEILSNCRIHLESGGPDARIFLSLQAEEMRAIHGYNHWRAVLAGAMAQHSKLEDWIHATRRPAPVANG